MHSLTEFSLPLSCEPFQSPLVERDGLGKLGFNHMKLLFTGNKLQFKNVDSLENTNYIHRH